MRALYDDFTRTFGNVLFAVCLFLVWGLLTLIGVIIAQGKDPQRVFPGICSVVGAPDLAIRFQ